MATASSLYENIGNLRNYVATQVPTTLSSSGFTGKLLMGLAIGFFIYVLILLLTGKKIDVSWADPRPKSMIVLSDATRFWAPSSVFTNLTTKHDAIPEFPSRDYSVLADCVLLNTREFSTTEGPWRHILHRGSNDLEQTTIGGAALSGCSSAGVGSNPLPPFGLPRRMNPGIFLDPNKNDLIIFVDTESGSQSYRESVRIPDIPMDIPFRLSLTLKNQVLNVYLNCRLEITKVLDGVPRSVENRWYGLAGAAAAQAQLQNLYVWRRALQADEAGAACSSPPVFDKKRPLCNSADSVVKPVGNTGTGEQKGMGYGNALDKCGV